MPLKLTGVGLVKNSGIQKGQPPETPICTLPNKSESLLMRRALSKKDAISFFDIIRSIKGGEDMAKLAFVFTKTIMFKVTSGQ